MLPYSCFVLHSPPTPFLLVAGVRKKHLLCILEALSLALESAGWQDMGLTGRHVDSLLDILINQHSQVSVLHSIVRLLKGARLSGWSSLLVLRTFWPQVLHFIIPLLIAGAYDSPSTMPSTSFSPCPQLCYTVNLLHWNFYHTTQAAQLCTTFPGTYRECVYSTLLNRAPTAHTD